MSSLVFLGFSIIAFVIAYGVGWLLVPAVLGPFMSALPPIPNPAWAATMTHTQTVIQWLIPLSASTVLTAGAAGYLPAFTKKSGADLVFIVTGSVLIGTFGSGSTTSAVSYSIVPTNDNHNDFESVGQSLLKVNVLLFVQYFLATFGDVLACQKFATHNFLFLLMP